MLRSTMEIHSQACWMSSAASAERRTGCVNAATGAGTARLQIREHVFPRTRGLRVFIEGLQPFPDDALDLRRHGPIAIVRVGGAGPGWPNRSGLAHGTTLRRYHALRNWTPCREPLARFLSLEPIARCDARPITFFEPRKRATLRTPPPRRFTVARPQYHGAREPTHLNRS